MVESFMHLCGICGSDAIDVYVLREGKILFRCRKCDNRENLSNTLIGCPEHDSIPEIPHQDTIYFDPEDGIWEFDKQSVETENHIQEMEQFLRRGG